MLWVLLFCRHIFNNAAKLKHKEIGSLVSYNLRNFGHIRCSVAYSDCVVRIQLPHSSFHLRDSCLVSFTDAHMFLIIRCNKVCLNSLKQKKIDNFSV